MRGPNRCEACLTSASRLALSHLANRNPGLILSQTGVCGHCGECGEVLDLPLLLVLQWRGVLRPDTCSQAPRFRLRSSSSASKGIGRLSIQGIRAALSEKAPGGIEAILALSKI